MTDITEQELHTYENAMMNGKAVDNTDVNLRLLLTDIYVSGGQLDPIKYPFSSDEHQEYLTCILNAGEGRPFVPFDFRAKTV